MFMTGFSSIFKDDSIRLREAYAVNQEARTCPTVAATGGKLYLGLLEAVPTQSYKCRIEVNITHA
jgi:hypothetical protein